MSQPPITPGPPPPYQPPAEQPHAPTVVTPPPASTRKTWPWIAGGVAVLIALTALGTAALVAPGEQPAAGTAGAAPVAATTAAKPTTPAPTTPSIVYGKPDAGEFKLSIKTLEKKCFGSAGCNVTYRIDPTYTGSLPLDPAKTYRLTYEVRGLEDGPAINNFTLTGDTATMDSEEYGSTTSTKVKLTAKVTDVVEE